MTASTEIENLNAQIAELRTLWNELAATGKHAEAVGVENEIAALERSAARYAIQQKAEQAENARLRAVDAAEATRAQIEKHRATRAQLELVVSEVEAAAKAVDAAMSRLLPAFQACAHSYPTGRDFDDPLQQEAYDNALGANKYPKFEPLRLALRLPLVLDVLRQRGNRGLNDILSVADYRF